MINNVNVNVNRSISQSEYPICQCAIAMFKRKPKRNIIEYEYMI